MYSLGCTLYFALSGNPPFEGGDMINKIFRQRLDDLGFKFRYVWDETWWLDDGQPTAFVCGHPDGSEIDSMEYRDPPP